jgi:histidine triad (HIT) family protein
MTDSNCIFCKIVAGDVPVERLYEDDQVLAFPDSHPQAPTHILVIPKTHFESHADATPEDQQLLGRILTVAADVARQQGLDGGYRLVINCGDEGGQTVPHLHLHILGGRTLRWPPG